MLRADDLAFAENHRTLPRGTSAAPASRGNGTRGRPDSRRHLGPGAFFHARTAGSLRPVGIGGSEGTPTMIAATIVTSAGTPSSFLTSAELAG
jgi:hypothetical protein